MDHADFLANFDFSGQVAVVTGGAGVLCSAMCRALARAGARVVVLGLRAEGAEKLAIELRQTGAQAIGLGCNVLDRPSLEAAARRILAEFGQIDILINGAGGNRPVATSSPSMPFFDLPAEALHEVTDLNLLGTLIPCQVFGRHMAERRQGTILNISSMSALRPLTRVPAYSAAKAGVINFTQWLAVTMAQEYGPGIRVNAIAPGFYVGEQNRRLLLNKDGSLTQRGAQIIANTPMGRFGSPEDLIGVVLWLLSPAAAYVTGIVIPVDGGFSAYAGV